MGKGKPGQGEKLKRVIKHRPSGRYYAGEGLWTADLERAKVFADLAVAMQTARDDGLEDSCIVVFRTGTREVDAQFPIF